MSRACGKICCCAAAGIIAVAVLAPLLVGQQAEREKSGLIGTPEPQHLRIINNSGRKPPSPVPVLAMPQLLQPMGIPSAKLGVFVLANDASIKLLDAKKLLTYGPYLKGQLGTEGGQLLDVVLDKKGKTALVSNFGDQKVFFVNLAKTAAPSVLGIVQLTLFAEDIALTPNGKFALVSDGGFSSKIASLNVKTRTLVQELELPSGHYANAIAVAKDNQTVVTADYFSRYIDYLLMDSATGLLTHKGRKWSGEAYPVNVVISPDGKTVFALAATVDSSTCGFGYLYLITGPGVMTAATQRVSAPSADIKTGHGAVFSKDGKKLYVLGGLEWDANGFKAHVIYVFNVTAPGAVAYSGVLIELYDFIEQGSQLFGVDSMALTPDGKYIYLSNHTLGGAKNRIAVVDLKLNAHVYSLIACDDDKAPAGISFKAF